MVLTTVATATTAVVPAAVAAAPPKPKAVGPMRSDPKPKPVSEPLRGDLSAVGNVPGVPAGESTPEPARPFDKAKATAIESETTATKKLYANPDGTTTAEISTRPTRFKDTTGTWRDIDLNLVTAADGTLGPKAGDPSMSARLSPEGDATAATLDTPAGTIGVRFAGATAAPATVDGPNATYRRALGTRDLSLALTTDGLEESVILPDATAGPSHTVEFALPVGTAVRETSAGIEFVAGDGAVVASFGSGTAHDANPNATAVAPVSVHVVAPPSPKAASPTGTPPPKSAGSRALAAKAERSTTTVSVEVGVDPGWLADPARVFPVTVDPTITLIKSTAPGWGRDTFVWGFMPTTNYGTSTQLLMGTIFGAPARDLLWFNLGITPAANYKVTNSYLQVWNYSSATCTPKPVSVQGLGGPWSESSTWNTKPPLDAAGVVSTTSFGHGVVAAGVPNCASAYDYLDTTSLAQRWLTGAPNWGLQLSSSNESDGNAFKGFNSGNTVSPPTMVITYKHNLDPAVDIAPSPDDGAVLTSATPILAVAPLSSPDGDPVTFDYLVTTSPDAMTGSRVVDSGWTSSTRWPVPQGSLVDGMTYWWQVLATDGTLTAYQAKPRSFRVDLGLGTKGPLPHDELGPTRVNLVNGNLVVGSASPRPSGLSFTYNSQATSGGLTGAYYPETSGLTPPPREPSGNPALVRRDSNIDSLWSAQGPGPLAPTNFRVRWKGTITLPEGTWGKTNPAGWTFGAYAQDGIVVKINGVAVVDRWKNQTWSAPAAPGFFGGPQQLIAGKPYSIQVDYYTHSPFGFVSLLAIAPDGKAGSVLPSWLQPDNDALPSGWTMAAASVSFVSARVSDAAVTLLDASGATHLYTANGTGGYTPPPDEDGTLATDAAGNLTLAASDGLTYVFDAGGQLVGATAATDDRYPSSPGYVWYPEVGNRQPGDATKPIDASKPMRLMAVTDPVGGRQHTLRYAGAPRPGQDPAPFDPAAPCPTPPPGFSPAPPYSLCEVDYWDLTSTKLWYVGAQLARIEDPGNPLDKSAANLPAKTDFAYSAGAMTAIRTPLANDAVAAATVTGVPADPNDDRTRTHIDYAPGSARVAKVTLPSPNAGSLLEAARPAHIYDLTVANQATVNVDVAQNLKASFEPAGFTRRVLFPPRAADGTVTFTDTNANGNSAKTAIDAGNHVLWSTDTAGRKATTVYGTDATRVHPMGQVTDTYGAAPPSCFGPDRKAVVPACPTPPAHTATTYDIDPSANTAHGLAATYWSNPTKSGLPARHDTVAIDGTGTLASGAANPPAEGLVAGAWSGRYTGEVNMAGAGTLSLSAAGSARLYVDDALVNGAFSNGVVGLHRVRIDYIPPATGSPQLTLNWTPGSIDLRPRYSNANKTVTDDDHGVPSAISNTVVEGPTGLVKAITQDPAGANLTNSVAYEEVGDGKFRRPTFRTLPAGDPNDPAHATSTASSYYAGVTDPGGQTVPADKGEANTCATDSTSVNQGGALHVTTSPAPNPTAPGLVRKVVYDVTGRVVASRLNNDPWTCTTYDARGRVATVVVPGLPAVDFGATATSTRIVSHSYAVETAPGVFNPLVGSVSDASGTITTTVDLLGRVVSTKDAYGNVSRVLYDQGGRQITSDGPGGRLDTEYSGGQVTRQRVAEPGSLGAGPALAAPAYDPISGELTGASYCSATQTTGVCATGGPYGGNGSTLAVGRDLNGRTNHLEWKGPGGGIVDDVVIRSQSAKLVDESVDGVDANTANPGYNFVYDGVGRLTEAWVQGHHLTYAFAAAGGCGPMAAAGKDSNRTATTDNSGPATTYCYDNADRLVSSTDAANVGTPAYNPHGDATRMGNLALGYDSSGRHVRSDASVPLAFSVTYTRDAANRLMSRTEGTTVTRYGFAGAGDNPAFATGANNVVTQRFIGLVGGVMVTKQASGDIWSYPNVHGDVVATATAAGVKLGAIRSYDPFGQSVSLPDNAPGNLDYGWLGQAQRPTEHAGASTIVEMGARPYSPAAGRFLQVDPVEGGSANDYDYVGGDPVNGRDLAGTRSIKHNPEAEAYWKEVLGPPVAPLPDPTKDEPSKSAWGQFVDFWNGDDSEGVSRRKKNLFSGAESNLAKKAKTYGPVCATGGAGKAAPAVVSGGVAAAPEAFAKGCVVNVAVASANNLGLPLVGSAIKIATSDRPEMTAVQETAKFVYNLF
ncbi:MAG TPA: DNRLRE domain-containing protein [Acidimicrobiales bacterium]